MLFLLWTLLNENIGFNGNVVEKLLLLLFGVVEDILMDDDSEVPNVDEVFVGDESMR